jgi:hypothetical protein
VVKPRCSHCCCPANTSHVMRWWQHVATMKLSAAAACGVVA